MNRSALVDTDLADSYGFEIALLIDTYRRFCIDAIAEVDLRERVHRNRLLYEG